MELWRRAANPWGQDVLIGVSWDLMWAALAASVLFLVGHAIWIRTRKEEAHEAPTDVPAGIPEKIERHSFAARAFHWVMSMESKPSMPFARSVSSFFRLSAISSFSSSISG